jgi:phage virion morphogenesis protein
MEMTLKIEENVSASLRKAAAAGADVTPSMAAIAGLIGRATKLNFRSQSDPLGVPWKASQRVRDNGGLMLVLSGDLFGSIREAWGGKFAEAGPEASGGAAIYAAVHQWGARIAAKVSKALKTPRGPRKAVVIPARPYVGWNEVMKGDAHDILAGHIQKAFNPSGALPA